MAARMAKGIARERQVRMMLEDEGWLVIRAAGSLGPCDLVAMRGDPLTLSSSGSGSRLVEGATDRLLIEIKSTAAGPYSHFGPARRKLLADAAQVAGAEAWLCWWPGDRRGPRWISSREWPT
jgi:Archaeal holliday junction resolvase (hjc)